MSMCRTICSRLSAVCANRGNPQVIAVKHVKLVAMIICLQECSLCCFIEFHIDSLHFWFHIWLSILTDCSLKGNLTWSMSVRNVRMYYGI